MRIKHATLAIFLFLDSCAQKPSPPGKAESPLAITNVTVIDVVNGTYQNNVTLLTRADRIAEIGHQVSIPSDAMQVDGTNKFVIPGLWDMHTHQEMLSPTALDLFVANGVIGTRDMGSGADYILSLRDRINRGELLGPEIVAAGPILDPLRPNEPLSSLPDTFRYFALMRRRVTNADEARTAVRDLKERGVDFIKVHDNTPRDAFFAIADETAKLGLTFAGHVPASVSIAEAIDSGIRSIEHLANFRVIQECGTADRCNEFYDRLAAKNVFQTPTIAFTQAIPDLFRRQPLPHAEYASDGLLASTRGNAEFSNMSDTALAQFRARGAASLSAIREMQARGVGILSACDALVPGFCLHDELEWMAKAGFTPVQALQTATINPARFLGREQTQGTVEAGKRADLVLLDGDPLVNIRSTRAISAVIVRGKLVPKSEITLLTVKHRR